MDQTICRKPVGVHLCHDFLADHSQLKSIWMNGLEHGSPLTPCGGKHQLSMTGAGAAHADTIRR